jgi:predicted alpha/beta-hydrolase family hydrolase
MQLILLGGNAPENEPWVRDIEKKLKGYFDSTYVFTYEHWETGVPLIDIDNEVLRLSKYVERIGPYIIFAKSAGSLVVAKAIKEGKISPKKCIFVGIPLDWARTNNFDAPNWISGVRTPTLVIQHTNDPFATSEQIKLLFSKLRLINIILRAIPGDDHSYNKINLVKKLVTDFTEK